MVNVMRSVPQKFSKTIIEIHQDAGLRWLQELPSLIKRCEERWLLRVDAPFAALSYNYVAPAWRADGTPVVLKLGVPNPELSSEIEALRLYDGVGSVQLLDADAQQGMLLLERLLPGTMLTDLTDDEQATSIAADVMRQLWRPVPANHAFPTIAKWSAGLYRLRQQFGGGTGPLPADLVEMAETFFEQLICSMEEPVLLHGDLHHFNILSAQRQAWLAIDPKGLIGEPAYDIGAFLRNPYPQLLQIERADRLLARRVDQFAEELGLDHTRILAWGISQAVLSACWSVEDHGHGWEYSIACANWLRTLLR